MSPEERKDFWARMNNAQKQSRARHWDPAAFGLNSPTRKEMIRQDWAKLCETETAHEYPVNYNLLNLTEDDRAFLADLKVGV